MKHWQCKRQRGGRKAVHQRECMIGCTSHVFIPTILYMHCVGVCVCVCFLLARTSLPPAGSLCSSSYGGCARRFPAHCIACRSIFGGFAYRCSIRRMACTRFLCGCARRCSTRRIACTPACLWRLCSQMLDPPHRLHPLLMQLCSQMLDPPHRLHLLLRRLCSQMLDPPHCLHMHLLRLCSQMLDTNCLHLLLTRL
jgi:hypothetical protein